MAIKYAGADWIKKALQVDDMSPLGERVADIIGQVTRGIYHVADEVGKVDWSDDLYIEWRTHWPLATYDGSGLTELVVHAHDLCIRVEIIPMSRTTLAIVFHPRSAREGGQMWERHPTLERHVYQVRDALALEIEAAIG